MRLSRFFASIISISITQRFLLAYNWPIESYLFQHQINGTFGEVRGIIFDIIYTPGSTSSACTRAA